MEEDKSEAPKLTASTSAPLEVSDAEAAEAAAAAPESDASRAASAPPPGGSPWTAVLHSAQTLFRKYLSVSLTSDHDFSSAPGSAVVLFGSSFDTKLETDLAKIRERWSRLIWITYRSDFSCPLGVSASASAPDSAAAGTSSGGSGSLGGLLGSLSEYRSDAGWGCMLRCCQMLLAEALLRLFGDDKFPTIARFFMDHDLEDICPLSLHRLFLRSSSPPGKWFGSYEAFSLFERTWNKRVFKDCRLMIARDGALYKDELITEASKPSIVVIPLMLGLGSLNEKYVPLLQRSLSMPQSIGIAGGRPNAAFYFVGYHEKRLLYLDPHTVQSAIPLSKLDHLRDEDFVTYRCPRILSIPVTNIDPALSLGFFCSSADDFKALWEFAVEMSKLPYGAIGAVEKRPAYMKDYLTASPSVSDVVALDDDEESEKGDTKKDDYVLI